MHERCFAESAESEIAEEKVTLLKTVESLDLAIMQSAQQHPYMPLSRLRSDDLPHLAVSLLSLPASHPELYRNAMEIRTPKACRGGAQN